MKQFLFWLFVFVSLPIISNASVMQGGGFRVHNGQINPILGEVSIGSNVVKIGGHPIAGIASGGGLSLRQGAVYKLVTVETPTPSPGGGGGGTDSGCRAGYPCDPRSQELELPDIATPLAALAANQSLVDRIVSGQLEMPGSVFVPGPGISIVIVDVGLASVERDLLRVVTAIGFDEEIRQFEEITLKYQIFDEFGNLLREQYVNLPTDGDILWAQNLNVSGLDLDGSKSVVSVEVVRGTAKASASSNFIFDDLRYLDTVYFDIKTCDTWWRCYWWVLVIIALTLFAIYQRNRIVNLLRKN